MLSSLEITLAQRDGKSYLKEAYVTQPFRVVPVGQYKRDAAAYLMIMSSSPGLLDRDEHQIKIHLAADTKLQLQTQAYQRLFQSRTGSSQTTQIEMKDGAVFSFVPHPVVPQQASSFKSHNQVKMGTNCHFLLSDIVTCGRKLTGEIFEFQNFQNVTEIQTNGKLVYKDNVVLRPKLMKFDQLGMLEGYTHQGTLVYLNTASYSVDEWIEVFYNRYQDRAGLAFGISKLGVTGLIIRILGNGGEELFEIFQDIQSDLWEQVLLPHPKTTV